MFDHIRALWFSGAPEGRIALDHLPVETAKRYRDEMAALDCNRCRNEDCNFRFSSDRLPEDAGGQSQCLRWAQRFTPLAWRNPDGRVIIMPQEALDVIRRGPNKQEQA